MSQWDDNQDPYNAPYNQDGGGPSAPAAGPNLRDQGLYDSVARMYQTLLGRPPESPDVIWNHIDGRQGNIYAIQQDIAGSDEGKAYAARPKAADPVTPNPGGDGGGGTPAPAPTPVVNGAPPPSVGTQSSPSVGPGTAAPTYAPPPALVKPPDFAFRDYAPTTAQNVLDDPEYQLMNTEGLRSIGANRAASGTLNTGGTLKDYIGFTSNLAGAKFNDIDSRRWNQYQGERGNAFDTWKANNGLGLDVYDRNVTNEYNNPFQYGMQGASLNQNNNQFNASLGQNNNQFNTTLDFNKWLEDYKRSTLDPFDQKYKTLSLL